MPVKFQQLYTKKSILILSGLFLLCPALLIHLGLIAFYDDEGIRSLVALEMQVSGNHITPTLFGEFYYNKPPLYNWILLALFELTGRNDEIIARLPTVFFLLVYAATIYVTVSGFLKQNRKELGILVALSWITCGRILFWDSMLGLIDICFSWVMYLLFMVIYREGERGRYGRLFISAYFLAAVGFLLKGFPALVFLGLALPAYFIWQKKWRRMFSFSHLAGVMVFLFLAGGYYAMYARYNGLEMVFRTLFDESAKRTFVEYSLADTLKHLFTFPFEILYHFLPWTLLVLYLFRRESWVRIRENKFISWNLLVFVITILPYWTSVEVYPRYLFMHIPLLFTVCFFLYGQFRDTQKGLTKWLMYLFFLVILLMIPASWFPLFWDAVQQVPQREMKSTALCLAMTLLAWAYLRWKDLRFLTFALVLLVARIGFNWFVLPSRLEIECSTKVRETTLEWVKITQGEPVYIYKNSLGFQAVTGYYYTRETGKILREQHGELEKGAYYIIHPKLYDPSMMEEVMRFTVKWECSELVLGYNP